MGKKGFKNLIVWKKAKELAVTVYKLSEDKALGRDFALRDQIRRSAVSIPLASRLLPLVPDQIDEIDLSRLPRGMCELFNGVECANYSIGTK